MTDLSLFIGSPTELINIPVYFLYSSLKYFGTQ